MYVHSSSLSPSYFSALLLVTIQFVALVTFLGGKASAQVEDSGLEPPPDCIIFGALGSDPFITLPIATSSNNFPPVNLPSIATATYTGTGSLPIVVDGKRIEAFNVKAVCKILSFFAPPFCKLKVSLTFCDDNGLGLNCNPSDPSYYSGVFRAAGTYPDPYDIFIGNDSDPDGQFDSELDTDTNAILTSDLSVSFVEMCF